MKTTGIILAKNITAVLLASLILPFCLVLQQLPGLFALGGIKPILIIPAVIAYSSFSRSAMLSSVLGLLCGLGWDIFMGRSVGYFGVFLFAVAVVTHYSYLNRSVQVGNYMMQVTIAAALLCSVDLLFFGFMLNYGAVSRTFTEFTLPTILYTGLFSPVVYGLLKVAFKLQEGRRDEG